MTGFDDHALALLAEIRDELRLLRTLAETRSPINTLRNQDRAALRKILPVIAANFETEFAVWELFDAASSADIIGANFRIVLKDQTPQRLGKLFQQTAGHRIDGLTLQRQGRDANGAVWRCIGNPSS